MPPARSQLQPKNAGISIALANHQALLRIRHSRLRSLARYVLREEAVPSAAIEIALVDDATLRSLHRRFLRKDSATDVLTFPLDEPAGSLAGEIVISVETAIREGPTHRTRPEEEVLLYLTHGILHLCGYNDDRTRSARRMHQRQEELLHGYLSSGIIQSRPRQPITGVEERRKLPARSRKR